MDDLIGKLINLKTFSSKGEKVPPSDEEELQGFKRKRDTAPDEEIHDGVMTSNSNVAANDESQSKGEET